MSIRQTAAAGHGHFTVILDTNGLFATAVGLVQRRSRANLGGSAIGAHMGRHVSIFVVIVLLFLFLLGRRRGGRKSSREKLSKQSAQPFDLFISDQETLGVELLGGGGRAGWDLDGGHDELGFVEVGSAVGCRFAAFFIFREVRNMLVLTNENSVRGKGCGLLVERSHSLVALEEVENHGCRSGVVSDES